MEDSITLWACPPLRARISQRQCGLNRARAQDSRHTFLARIAELGAGPAACVGCRGLESWAEQTGEAPRRVETAALVREHRDKDAHRRRVAGAPPAGPARAAGKRRRPGAVA